MELGKKTTLKRTFFLVVVVAITVEILLRLFGINQTNEEEHLNFYSYKYKTNRPTWFHTWQANTSIEYGNGEFLYHNTFNELGHRELSFKNFEQDSTSIKIVCLGDSFTEGDGAPYDSSWVRFFEKNLALELDTPVFAYNAGVCGSDVLFNGVMFKEKLLAAQPNIVFECVNNSDITDIYYRGGSERFLADGSLGAPNEKKWEVFYKYSYLFRALLVTFTQYNNNLINHATIDKEENEALHLLIKQLEETAQLCKENNIDYHVIMMPVPNEIMDKSAYIFDSLAFLLPEKVAFINLFPSTYASFDTLDIYQYSWPKNGHYNSMGYEVMSSCIFEEYVHTTTKPTQHVQ